MIKLKDDKGVHIIPDTYGISYVSLRTRRTHQYKKKRCEYILDIGFSRDMELYLTFKNKKKATAQYDKIIKRMKREH